MIGAIIGDIVGSRFEFHNHKSKEFDLFTDECFFTDDTVMTLAVAKSLMDGTDVVKEMKRLGQLYPGAGWGAGFGRWLFSDSNEPYYSFGNGAAMRVSAAAYVAGSITEAIVLSRKVTEVTHDHPEGIKGAEAVTVAIYCALHGWNKEQIKGAIKQFYYDIDFTLDEIRDSYKFNETCQGSVPQALEAFFESENFEDAIRNAISIGGDSDTIAAITGSVAEAYYGVPAWIRDRALDFLDVSLGAILYDFEKRFGC